MDNCQLTDKKCLIQVAFGAVVYDFGHWRHSQSKHVSFFWSENKAKPVGYGCLFIHVCSYPFPPPSNLWYKDWTLLPGNDLYMVFSNGYSMYIYIYILFMYPLLCSIWHVYVIRIYIYIINILYLYYIHIYIYIYYYNVYILPRLEVHQEAEVKVAEVVCWCFFLVATPG